ncbi:DUF2189 domain-containing protein [Laribacter hongkongensis]|uniref:DUF2189 domain-containing protein n=1 Tax=Laribacter hongkongensis TaxID=168471 RepID=UPI0003F61AAB|nr:DUF2189 domain-containing protein [Laribacter hongkongensis]
MDIPHEPVRPALPAVRRVNAFAPLGWCLHALTDLQRAWLPALFYGVAFVVMGFLLFGLFARSPVMVMTLSAAFLLLGPFLAAGLYAIARDLERTGTASLRVSLTAWRGNVQSVTLFAALLAIMTFIWFRVSLLVFALFATGPLPTLDSLLTQMFAPADTTLLVLWFGIGLAFAALVFVVSVVSIPMMIDREIDAFSAMLVSLRAVRANLPAMLVWAALLAGLALAGFASGTLGLAVTMPIAGLASWHAYRDMVSG